MPEVNYFWDEIEDNVVREYDDDNNTVANYTTEPTLYGSVTSQERSGETRFYHFDGHGNTTELTDNAGNVTDTRRYSAFGEVTLSSGTTEVPYQFVGQRAYYRDTGASLYHVRRRAYAARLGQWYSLDPLMCLLAPHGVELGSNEPAKDKRRTFNGLLAYVSRLHSLRNPIGLFADPAGFDLNLYRYCHNSPIDSFDPSGLDDNVCGFNFPPGLSEGAKKAIIEECKRRGGIIPVPPKPLPVPPLPYVHPDDPIYPWPPPHSGKAVFCGYLSFNCPGGGAYLWPVYGDSDEAKGIIGTGCVTMVLLEDWTKRIVCSMGCAAIKTSVSIGNMNIPILDHEACHACSYEEGGWPCYVGVAIVDDCDKHPVLSWPQW